jgi:hypothetical protein
VLRETRSVNGFEKALASFNGAHGAATEGVANLYQHPCAIYRRFEIWGHRFLSSSTLAFLGDLCCDGGHSYCTGGYGSPQKLLLRPPGLLSR